MSNGLVGDIKKVVVSYGANSQNKSIDRVVLVGGGAYLKGIVPYLTTQMGIEVTLGGAFEGLKVGESTKNLGTAYSVATGLATEEQ